VQFMTSRNISISLSVHRSGGKYHSLVIIAPATVSEINIVSVRVIMP
jgi:hypothetical protein